MKKNAKHWWEIFQRSPHKQKKPYILYYTFGKEKFSYYGKAEHTANIWKHKLKHENQSSPAHISSHLCGKDLGNYQFNPVEKKKNKKAVAKKVYDLPIDKKLITSKTKTTTSTSKTDALCTVHFLTLILVTKLTTIYL